MAENNVVEKIETTVAVDAVTKADEKVKAIQAERKAAVEARCAKRDKWRGPLKIVGKIVNAYDREPAKMWGSTLLGGAAGAGLVILVEKTVEHFGKSKDVDETTEDEIEEVEAEVPFDTTEA